MSVTAQSISVNNAVNSYTLQLKGTYYLTKIVHQLLPDQIPDIYQASETKDGTQTLDRERISHTAGQEKLQEARCAGDDEEKIAELMITEMGDEMSALDMKLEAIGISFNIDSNVGNYTRNTAGKVNYLESFKPWQKDIVNPKELEVLFDEPALREAINELTDERGKKECLQYLERLLVLLEEEKKNLQKQKEPEQPDCRERVEAFNVKYAPYLTEEALAHLNAITSLEEALEDIQRKSAKTILIEMLQELQAMKSETSITQ